MSDDKKQTKYLYNDTNHFDFESQSFSWANSREEAIRAVTHGGRSGYIAEAIETEYAGPSFPEVEDLIDSALENSDVCSDWTTEACYQVDFEALKAKLGPLFEQIDKIIVEALRKDVGPMYMAGESEFVDGSKP